MGIWEDYHRSKGLSTPHIKRNILSTWLTNCDVNVGHLAKVVFSRFLLCKVVPLPFFGNNSSSLALTKGEKN